ncbi:SRPBCC family protein [Ideonella azotifigens]|nr:SRPBCC family protein [Ideonella azotifigens]MCD2342755.1 SRPBCC family protein [Ideonella azotifigens]
MTTGLRIQMPVEALVTIDGTAAAVWAAMSNIENAAEIISGVKKIEVVEKPASGLVGLKWRETRMLFDEPATVEKWITDAVEDEFYKTRAESHGFVFLATLRISERGGVVTLHSAHESIPQGFVARLKLIPMAFFKGVMKKALLQDLNDIKSAVESAGAGARRPA